MEILEKTFKNLLEQFSLFATNFISAVVIVLIGYLAAKLSKTILVNVLSRIGLDVLGEKIQDIEAIKKLKIEFKLSKVIGSVVYFFVYLIFLITAADKLGIPAISNLFAMIVAFIPNLIAASILIVLGLMLSDMVRNFVETLCKSFNIPSGKLIGMGVFTFLVLITIITALSQSGINTDLLESSFNILIGGVVFSFAIGYGFASKEILHNIVSSFYSRGKYKVGDTIEIEGKKGLIISMDSTSVTLEVSGVQMVVPMKKFQSEIVTVHSN